MIRTVVHFVDSTTFGGTEQALLHLLAGLDGRRWRPVVFHHAEPGLVPLLEGARRLNIKTKIVPQMRGIRTIAGLPVFLQQLWEERPAVFHAHQSWLLSCKYGLFAAALARVPAVIATAQQFMEPPWGRTVYLQQQLFEKCVDRYIAVSDSIARQLSQTFRVPALKVQVIHNTIPLAQFDGQSNQALKTTLSRGRERPIILTVARLDQQKGHVHLLDAISQVPDAIFVMAGDGPEKAALEARTHKLGIDDRVIFLGYRKDTPELLASCDLFVLPSVYEGLPLSILEAMAAEKAVVATAVGGIPEAVLDGETGFLVPPRDPTALARAIQTVLSNPSLARRMGAAGKARVQRAFSSATMVQRITQTYEEVLDRRENSRACRPSPA
jgi:glycosyltransferase involved in cell wall biosynthesis